MIIAVSVVGAIVNFMFAAVDANVVPAVMCATVLIAIIVTIVAVVDLLVDCCSTVAIIVVIFGTFTMRSSARGWRYVCFGTDMHRDGTARYKGALLLACPVLLDTFDQLFVNS